MILIELSEKSHNVVKWSDSFADAVEESNKMIILKKKKTDGKPAVFHMQCADVVSLARQCGTV